MLFSANLKPFSGVYTSLKANETPTAFPVVSVMFLMSVRFHLAASKGKNALCHRVAVCVP